MLGGDELEVNGMDERPYLPRSLASVQKVVLELVSDSTERVAGNKTKVGKEDTHKDGTDNRQTAKALDGAT